MFIQSEQYTTLQGACGILVQFDTLKPQPSKIGDIIQTSREAGVTTIDLYSPSVSYNIQIGDLITIKASRLTSVAPENIIDSSYIGTFKIIGVTYSGDAISSITYNQNLPDIATQDVTAEIWLQNNIEPSDNYSISFYVESAVPSGAIATLSPSGYISTGNESFTPITTIQLISKYSNSAKSLVKMIVKSLEKNTTVKTQYKEIVISDNDTVPCQIISADPIDNSYIYLNKENNWTYNHEGYTIAKLIPDNSDKNTEIILSQKNNQLLPSKGGDNRLRIVADPRSLIEKKVSIDNIRNALVNEYNSINNSFLVANIGTKSYDIVLDNVQLSPQDLDNMVVAIVPPISGQPVKLSEVAEVEPYFPDLIDIPNISFLKYSNNNLNYVGELHYNGSVYENDIITINHLGNTITGIIRNVTAGETDLSVVN